MVMATVQEHRFTFPGRGLGFSSPLFLWCVCILRAGLSWECTARVLWPLTLIHLVFSPRLPALPLCYLLPHCQCYICCIRELPTGYAHT